MASRSFSRALRSPLTRQLAAPAAQRRTLISASRLARTGVATPLKPTVTGSLQHSRGLKQIDFAGTKETVYGKSQRAIAIHLRLTVKHRARGLAAGKATGRIKFLKHAAKIELWR